MVASGSSSGRQPTAAEALGGSTTLDQDAALRRLRKTPRVFQSNPDSFSYQLRRELRSNLLPSILKTPAECVEGVGVQKKQAVVAEVEGQHYSSYKEKLEQRERAEAAHAIFMERDGSLLSDADPQRVAAGRCSVFKDLVDEGRKNDRLKKFRRPQEGLVNIASGLPFSHADEGFDLAELGNILTLDLERRANDVKLGGGNVAAFLSLQVASRVPLVVRDPVNFNGEVRQSEPLPANDVHVLRVDLRPGEVRQVQYNLNDREFKESELAGRMNALVDPEQGTLAGVVRMLKAKDSESKAALGVLNDVLRGQGGELALPPKPELPPEGEVVEAMIAREAPKRLQALTAETRRSLSPFMDAMDELAQLAQPLVPSLAHALDRAALICVREADRLVMRSHQEIERLYTMWATAEEHRRLLHAMVDRLGGGENAMSGAEQRAAQLRQTLARQEEEYAKLLKEHERVQGDLEESRNGLAVSQSRITEMKAMVAKLQLENKGLRESAASARDGAKGPAIVPVAAPMESAAPAQLQKADAVHGDAPAVGRTPSSASCEKGEDTLPFSMHAVAQTEDDFLFHENAPLHDELSRFQYDELTLTCNRLYRVLCSYEWNSVTGTYLLTSPDPAVWADEFAMDDKVIEFKRQSKLPADLMRQVSSLLKLAGLAGIKVKVERICQEARVVQLEDEIGLLQKSAKLGFDQWAVVALRHLSSPESSALSDTFDANKLWSAVTEMVETGGLRKRVRELEEQLGNILPMSSKGDGGVGMDSAFWRRAIQAARKDKDPPKGPTRRSNGAKKGNNIRSTLQVMELGVLREEMQRIWESMSDVEEAATVKFAKTSSEQLFQGCIKRYYLVQSGRTKHVEAAVVNLCRSVLEHLTNNFHVALFAVLSGMQSASSMGGDAVPNQRHVVRWQSNFKLEPHALSDMPLDAVHCLASLMREVEMVRHTHRDLAGPVAAGDDSVPLQVAMLAGLNVVANRSKATSRFFWSSLYALTDLPGDGSEEGGGADRPRTEGGNSTATDGTTSSSSDGGRHTDEVISAREVVYMSHLLAVYLNDPDGEGEAWRAAIDELWMKIVQEDPDVASVGKVRAVMGMHNNPAAVAATVAAEVIVRHAELPVPPELVATALAAVAMGSVPRAEDVEHVEISAQHFEAFAMAWSTASTPARCKRSLLLWAAAWSLAHERGHEIELMGELFQLYDVSADGWLQYSEFSALIAAMTPQVSQTDSEEMFLAGAEDVTGDMTKEVFLRLATRMGISTDIDLLEHLVTSKRAG